MHACNVCTYAYSFTYNYPYTHKCTRIQKIMCVHTHVHIYIYALSYFCRCSDALKSNSNSSSCPFAEAAQPGVAWLHKAWARNPDALTEEVITAVAEAELTNLGAQGPHLNMRI